MTSVDVSSFLGQASEPGTQRLDSDALHQLARILGVGSAVLDQALSAAAAQLGVSLDPFELRLGDWSLDLPRALLRSLVNGTVLTAALTPLGAASVPTAVISALVPLLFDLERVQLDTKDRYLYAVLRQDPERWASIDEWFASLPDWLQDDLGYLEFRTIVQRLARAGLVEVDLLEKLSLTEVSHRRIARLELPPLG